MLALFFLLARTTLAVPLSPMRQSVFYSLNLRKIVDVLLYFRITNLSVYASYASPLPLIQRMFSLSQKIPLFVSHRRDMNSPLLKFIFIAITQRDCNKFTSLLLTFLQPNFLTVVISVSSLQSSLTSRVFWYISMYLF